MSGENSEASSDATFHARLAAVLGDRYELGEEIGRGGMGIVYRALDKRLQRTVALKLLPPELAFRAEIKSRFLREAISAAQLNHPNIVPIYSVDEFDGLVFFAMGFVDGENLGTVIAREGPLTHARVRTIMQEVAEALAFAHARGMVHRDIKADNIIIDRLTQRAMVTDFGIARAISDVGDTKLTATGVAIGTPAYMSPEQCAGDREIDGRSDLYSLGIVGYQMLCGRTPFVATSTPAMLIKQFSELPQDIQERRRDTPRDLATIVMRLLEKKPENRFADGRELAASLKGEIAVVGTATRAEVPEHVRGDRLPERTWRESDGAYRRRVPFRDKSAAEKVKTVRSETASWIGMSVFLMFINLASSPQFTWFIFPMVGMGLGVWKKWSILWSQGMRWGDVYGANARKLMSGGGTLDELRAASSSEAARIKDAKPDDLLASQYGDAVRQARSDHEVIRTQVGFLSVADRSLIPDVLPVAESLLDRIDTLGSALISLDRNADAAGIGSLDAEIVSLEAAQLTSASNAGERKLVLLRKQRSSLVALVDSKTELQSQFESAALMLRNLALDVLKLRSSGIQSVMNDVNSATQEARALVKEIGHVLGAADEMRAMESKSRR